MTDVDEEGYLAHEFYCLVRNLTPIPRGWFELPDQVKNELITKAYEEYVQS